MSEPAEDIIPRSDWTLGRFWKWNYGKATRGTDKYCDASIEYFNSKDATLESLGQKYGVTRERIRQHLEKEKTWIYNSYFAGLNGNELFHTVEHAAEKMTEINLLPVKDDEFTPAGIGRLMADLFSDKFEIIKDRRLNGEWLVLKEMGVGEMLNVLINELNTRPDPMKIEDVMNLFPISEDMLMSLKDLMEKNGYITLSTNKEASRTGTPQRIFDCLESLNRPALASEIAELTGLGETQVRGALSMDDNFVNVGRSLYELNNMDYCDLSMADIARNFLIGNQKAMKIDAVVNYVLLHYDANESEVLKELLSRTDLFGEERGFIYLAELGPDSIKIVSKKKYDIPLDEAILSIINNSDEIYDVEGLQMAISERFGDKASTNANSIEATLVTLCANNLISRVGGDKTGCYKRNKGHVEKVIKDLKDIMVDGSGEDTTEDGLSGWARDVWECVKKLDGATFGLSDIYQYVDELKLKYPNNNNIEAKIRQQLQVLGDKGFLEFDGEGRYRVI